MEHFTAASAAVEHNSRPPKSAAVKNNSRPSKSAAAKHNSWPPKSIISIESINDGSIYHSNHLIRSIRSRMKLLRNEQVNMEPSMYFDSKDSGRMIVVPAAPILSSNAGVLEAEALTVEVTLEVLDFALNSFIDAPIDDISSCHKFAHFMSGLVYMTVSTAVRWNYVMCRCFMLQNRERV
jgi:hypothetical protein